MIDLHYEYWNRKTHYPCLHDKKTRDNVVYKTFSARKDDAFREDQWGKCLCFGFNSVAPQHLCVFH